MQELDDNALLREYAERNAEQAFATLVARHVNKVYSVALRHTRNSHQAEEITQAVFVILARKSRQLSKSVILSGWLYHTARLTALTSIRSEIRRARREQEAYMQTSVDGAEAEVWPQIAPLLDAAMAALNEADRHAVVLRFFDGKSIREVGTALGASEDAAKMRLSRAVEKLRLFFTRRGVVHSAEVLAATISTHSVQTAPAALTKTVVAAALSHGATTSTSTLTLIKGALKIMAWTKAKTAIVVGLGVLLAAGTTSLTVKAIAGHRSYPWQRAGFDGGVLDKAPPLLAILPSQAPYGAWGNMGNKMMGTGVSAQSIVEAAYEGRGARTLKTVLRTKMPAGKYDYIASLPDGNTERLREEVKRKFGLVARHETNESNVLLLTLKSADAPGLRPGTSSGGSSTSRQGEYTCVNQPLSNLAGFLMQYFKVPIIDQSDTQRRFDIDLRWNERDRQHPNLDGLKDALREQLGLELLPATEAIDVLVVEKAN